MQVYDIAQVLANPLAVFHQADNDIVFVELDGNRYEIRQVAAKSPLDVPQLAQLHEQLRTQPAISVDDIVDDVRAGRDRSL